jgi:hypothetical protein
MFTQLDCLKALLKAEERERLAAVCLQHSHKVSGSMGSRYGVAVRGTLLARDFYT